MTKADIVNVISKETGIDKNQVQMVIESFMDNVKKSILSNNGVYLRGFGSFLVKHRAMKTARNITAEKTVTIPAHCVPAFKPSREFICQVKEKLTNV